MKTKFDFIRNLCVGTAIVAAMVITGCSKKGDLAMNPVSNGASNLKATVATADGFAAGTTGGAGGTSVTATTASAFATYATSSTKYIITVSGSLNIGNVGVAANKTIIGANSGATLIGNLGISNTTNVIVQNLTITNPSGVGTADGIEVSGSTKVFITKCTLSDCADGEIDIVRASDYVTVSWCKFQYPTQTVHNFVNLIGNGDAVTTDRGKLHVTMHHNWYAAGCKQRMPRVRFGQVHCYNNFYGAASSDYCLGVGEECQILLQNCSFENQSVAWSDAHTVVSGKIHWSGLYMVGTSTPTWASNSTVFTPTYSYSLIDASTVKSVVTAGAGNVTTSAATLTKHGSGSSSQTVTLGTTIASFYYTWANATSVTVSGLPSGVTATISSPNVTISGTPTVKGTFPFTVTTTGGSPNATTGGTITVN
jgi:pectate lyase